MGKKLIDEDIAKKGMPFETIKKKEKIKDLKKLDKEFKKIVRR